MGRGNRGHHRDEGHPAHRPAHVREFAAYWPGKTAEDDPIAEFIDNTKVVVSTTLGEVG